MKLTKYVNMIICSCVLICTTACTNNSPATSSTEPAPTQLIQLTPEPTSLEEKKEIHKYIGNADSKKFHYEYCISIKRMKEENKIYMECTREEAIAQGYIPCKKCNP